MIIKKIIEGSVTKQELLSWKDDVGNNLWHILSSENIDSNSNYYFFQICNKIQPEELKEKIFEKNNLGDTPLHIIAWSNSSKLLKYLLEQQSIDLNQAIDNQGRNIGFIATEMSHIEIIDLCFDHKIDLSHHDKKGKTLENYALSYDNKHCIAKIKKIKNIADNSAISHADNSNEILSFFQDNKVNLRGNKNI